MWLSALGGCSIARCVGEVRVKVLHGAEGLGTQSPVVNWERSTCRNVGLLSMLMLWVSSACSCCGLVILVEMLLLAPGPHSVLQGTPLGTLTVRVDVLLVGRDTCMQFYWEPSQS